MSEPSSEHAKRSRRRRKPGRAAAKRPDGPDLLHRALAHRGAVSLVVSACVLVPAELHARHPGRVGPVIVVVLIYAAIVRLLILVVDRAPEDPRPRPRPTVRSQRWKLRYGVIAFVSVIALSFGVSAARSAAGLGWPEATRGSLILDLIFLLALLPLRRLGGLGMADLGLRRTPRKLAVGLFLFGLALISVFDGIWRAVVELPRIEDALAGLPHTSTLTIVLTGIALCAAAPVVEEVFFRGFLYRCVRNRLAVLPAALIVGIVFGLGHTQYPLLERPQQAAFGFIACVLYERSGSLAPGIALHVFVDASAFELALTGEAWIVPVAFLAIGIVVLYTAPKAARRAGSRRRIRPGTA